MEEQAYYWIRWTEKDSYEMAYYLGHGAWQRMGILGPMEALPETVIGPRIGGNPDDSQDNQEIPNEHERKTLRGMWEKKDKDSDAEAPSGQHIRHVCNELADFLIAKNKAYGNSALEPVRCFSKADTVESINVRLDDKISRLMRGDANGEDVEEDLLGYLVLKRVFYHQEVLRKEMELKDRKMELEREKRQEEAKKTNISDDPWE